MKRIFSGIRPSGKLHLGNYLGAIKNWINLQETHEAVFAVVDLHGLTTPFDPAQRQEEIRDVVIDYIAAGLDPEKATIIVQSHVPEHLELSWILASTTPLSWLDRIPTFKEKIEKHPENINLGLLSYPVLMAADILLYNADAVPVGEDQLPHIELARQIGRRFNSMYSDVFKEPEAILSSGKRIMSLKNPTEKMSKTGGAGIALSDSPDEIMKKIKKAVTDSGENTQTKTPAIANLFTLLEAFAEPSVVAEFDAAYKDGSIRYSEFKETLGESIVEYFKPFREKREELSRNSNYIDTILEDGASKAREMTTEHLKEVKKAVGLI